MKPWELVLILLLALMGLSAIVHGVLSGQLRAPSERTYNLLVTDWNQTPPVVEILDYDISGADCIRGMEDTFVGPDKLLSCEFDEGEWDE